MFSILTYRLVHLLGLGLTLMGIAALTMHARNRGENPSARKLAVASHGVGLLLMLVGGFGAMARMGISWPWPPWLMIKMVVWFALGGLPAVIKKKPQLATAMWWTTFALLGLAAYMAGFKPLV